jgi:hypothetical protein
LGSLPAVANGRAPCRRHAWIAARPTPPAAAWIRTRSPGATRATSCNACSAVTDAVTIDAACSKLSVGGLRTTWAARATTWEAWAPQASATTSSPTASSATSAPQAVMVPAHSMPSTRGSGSASSAAAGNMPRACSTSRKLSPDACTRIITSSGSSTRGGVRRRLRRPSSPGASASRRKGVDCRILTCHLVADREVPHRGASQPTHEAARPPERQLVLTVALGGGDQRRDEGVQLRVVGVRRQVDELAPGGHPLVLDHPPEPPQRCVDGWAAPVAVDHGLCPQRDEPHGWPLALDAVERLRQGQGLVRAPALRRHQVSGRDVPVQLRVRSGDEEHAGRALGRWLGVEHVGPCLAPRRAPRGDVEAALPSGRESGDEPFADRAVGEHDPRPLARRPPDGITAGRFDRIRGVRRNDRLQRRRRLAWLEDGRVLEPLRGEQPLPPSRLQQRGGPAQLVIGEPPPTVEETEDEVEPGAVTREFEQDQQAAGCEQSAAVGQGAAQVGGRVQDVRSDDHIERVGGQPLLPGVALDVERARTHPVVAEALRRSRAEGR